MNRILIHILQKLNGIGPGGRGQQIIKQCQRPHRQCAAQHHPA